MNLQELIDQLIRLQDGLDNRGGQVTGQLSIAVPDGEPIVLDLDGVDRSHELIDLSKLFRLR